jgi:hypothetical protein
MIRHILLLQPGGETTRTQIDEARQAITSLVGRIPGLINVHWGENFVAIERRDGFTHGFTMDFADRESLAAYSPHPDHKAAAALVRAAFTRIVAFDFEL